MLYSLRHILYKPYALFLTNHIQNKVFEVDVGLVSFNVCLNFREEYTLFLKTYALIFKKIFCYQVKVQFLLVW